VQLSTNLCVVWPQITHDVMFDSLQNSAGIQCCCIGITTKPLVLPAGKRLKFRWCEVSVYEVKFGVSIIYTLLKK
jgi:hypothetical protein